MIGSGGDDNGARTVATGSLPDGTIVALRIPVGDEPMPEAPSPYDDWGPRLPIDETARVGHRLIVMADGEPAGVVSWHRTHYGPNAGSLAWNIGIALVPDARGRGIGSLAQWLLARHLFDTTPLFRIEASTDVDNIGEQRALERAGFTREGVLRSAQERADGRHDVVSYSFLRDEA